MTTNFGNRKAGLRLAAMSLALAARTVSAAPAAAPDTPTARAAEEATSDYGRCASFLLRDGPLAAAEIETCRRGATSGIPGASYAAALALLQEEGRPRLAEARTLLDRAAAAGHPSAALRLSGLELKSTDLAERERGRKHFNIAYCAGEPEALSIAPRLGFSPKDLACTPASRHEMSGTWTGHLAWVVPSAAPGDAGMDFRVVIADGKAQVFLRAGERWQEIKPGAFTVTELHGTAVVRSLDNGWNLDGEWVESWTLHLQWIRDGEVGVSLARSLNNVYFPADSPYRSITALAGGRAVREKS